MGKVDANPASSIHPVDDDRYCGSTEDYCGTGCQPLFGGQCLSKTGTAKCGNLFGGAACPSGQCCNPEVGDLVDHRWMKPGLNQSREIVAQSSMIVEIPTVSISSVGVIPIPLPSESRPPRTRDHA